MLAIEQFCKKFDLNFVVPQDLALRAIGKQLFLFTNEQAAFISARQPVVGGGILLGNVEKNVFKPSAQFIDMFLKDARFSVTLPEKVAWLFLCGRDVIEASGVQPDLQVDTYVTLKDVHGQILGYGQLCNPLRARGVVIKNLYDKGILLRREMK